MASFVEAVQSGVEFSRKNRTYNALRQAYGDAAAGAPGEVIQLEAMKRAQAAEPGALEAQQLENAGAAQEQQFAAQAQPGEMDAQQLKNAAERRKALLNGALYVQSAQERGGDPVEAFTRIAPHLGLSPEQVAAAVEDLRKDPNSTKDTIAALRAEEESARYTTVQGADGQIYRLGASGPAEAVSTAGGAPVQGYQAPLAQDRLTQGADRLDLARTLSDPGYIQNKNAAVAAGKVAGGAAANLPATEAVFEDTRASIAAVRTLPGLDAIFGSPTVAKALKSGGFGALWQFPGSEAADAAAQVMELTSKIRLQGFAILKGAGQITEAESKFAAEAMANLDRHQSKDGFLRTLTRLETVLAKKEAANRVTAGAPPAAKPVSGGFKYLGKE